jgi:hypothetical protein
LVDAVGVTMAEPDVRLLVVKLLPVQLVALVDDHVSVDDSPAVMVFGLTMSTAVDVAVGKGVTVIIADAVALPSNPVHVIEYVVDTVGDTTEEPAVTAAVNSLPTQLVELVELQERVELSPEEIVAGLAVSVTVGSRSAEAYSYAPRSSCAPDRVRVWSIALCTYCMLGVRFIPERAAPGLVLASIAGEAAVRR